MNDLSWLERKIDYSRRYSSTELMQLCHDISYDNVLNGGGPFGAIVTNGNGQIISVGVNRVIPNHDSTCHAEVMAIREAERKLQTHNLSAVSAILYTSCCPCYMCFGAVWWSGIKHICYDLTKQEAQKLGFQEGPTNSETWKLARQIKGIILEQIRCDIAISWRAFEKFKEIGLLY
ncbi:MAG: nucleoside deaminase [Deltaproteobacteria bacterium]|nr:nucleoside deaminase [Deltaproteobacteria bacterium]